jgi:RHS repeat-associated protein
MSRVRLLVVCLFVGILSASFSSLSAATATALLPAPAPRGARAIVVGSGLDAGSIAVTFAAAGGGTATAVIISRSPSVTEIVVPPNAVSGDVRVSSGAVAIGTLPFTLLPDPPFAKVTTLAASDKAHDVFKDPSGVAVIPSTGAVVVADRSHHQIKVVALNGQVTVLAGIGKPGLADGAGVQAKEPRGIAVDETRKLIYVADSGNNVIRRITYDGMAATFAGSGRDEDFKQPVGLAIDAAGNVYVADTGNSRIRIISPQGAVTTIAGGAHEGFADGVAAQALFKQPEGVAVDASGAVFVTDTKNNVIRKVQNGLVSTIAGTGHGGYTDGNGSLAEFKEPSGISVDDAGTLYVADVKNNLIRRITSSGIVSTLAGIGKSGLVDGDLAVAQFNQPAGIAFASAIYVADTANGALRVIVPVLHAAAVYPHAGPIAGGNQVRILGTGFLPGVTQVLFGSTSATAVTFATPTEVLCTAPAGSAGVVDVKVTTPAASDVLTASYTYLPPPTIATVQPRKGHTAGADSVTITGTNFDTSSETTVRIGGAAASGVMVGNETNLGALTPPGAAGPADVVVTTTAGSATRNAAFTYFAPPVISAFLPAQGSPGTVVTISGLNFDADAAGNVVLFGTLAAVVQTASATQLIVIVPDRAATGRITVATAGGSASSATEFSVGAITALQITSVASSVAAGDSVQFNAIGLLSNGTARDVTATSLWTSSNTSVAIVSTSGVVTALDAGVADISASLNGFNATQRLTAATLHLPPSPAAVAPPLNDTVAPSLADSISFLYAGVTPIQTGVVDDTIVAPRASLLRGLVKNSHGTALAGVRISVAGHPEFGQTLSRADGGYDLVVNGGGRVVLSFDKNGYMPAQRHFTLTWADTRVADDVVLLAYDSAVTPVALTAAAPAQLAQSSVSTDGDGVRKATLIFPAGAQASLKLPDGTSASISSLNIRATEYTVGPLGQKSMPATLPASSGYTYCVELSADEAVAAGATGVQFTKPVALYIDNFLNFPVGMSVPTGYYDRTASRWIAADNGRVVKIVSIVNGIANLDMNGDGILDDLTPFGITIPERSLLATKYAAGATLWRVTVQHFSPWDTNWPYGPPAGATSPMQPRPEQTKPKNDTCKLPGYSIIDCQNQSLGESIPIAGTPFSLEYSSGRNARTQYSASVPLTGATIPASLKRIDVAVQIAGRVFSASFAASPNLKWPIVWDGIDAYGRVVPGGVSSVVDIGYVYDATYQTPALVAQAFSTFSGVLTGIKARSELTIHQQTSVTIGHLDASAAKIGHWTFSPQMLYDSSARVLYGPGGDQRSASDDANPRQQLTIHTAEATSSPSLLTPTPDGGYYYRSGANFILKVDATGFETEIAGTFFPGSPTPDGVSALHHYVQPFAMALSPDGVLYFVDGNTRIRRIVNGILQTVAGNGAFASQALPPPDGVAATSVPISAGQMTFGPDGLLYFQSTCGAISRVGTDGILSTVAGGGTCASTVPAPEGSAAAGAVLWPVEMTIGDDGSMYIVDALRPDPTLPSYTVIRRIGTDGRISTVAGSLNRNAPAVLDGFPATSGSALAQRDGISVAHDGTLFFVDDHTRIRAVGADDLVSTVIGNGLRDGSTSPNGTLAKAAVLNNALSIRVTADQRILYSDGDRGLIRVTDAVLPPVTGTTLIPSADGAEVYELTPRHTRTINARTGTTIYTFGYDAAGRLTSVTDVDGQITTIERSAAGDATAIVASGGERTTLSISNGQLIAIVDPMQHAHQFTYGPHSMLATLTDPRQGLHKFTYDTQELLQKDEDPAGGSLTMTRTGSSDDFTVSSSSAEGESRSFRIVTANGDSLRTSTASSGLSTLSTTGSNAVNAVTLPNGVQLRTTEAADPRFGTAASYLASVSSRMPSGLTLTASHSRSVTLANSTNPLSIRTWQESATVNGKTWTSSFDASTRTLTNRSPAGRIGTSILDARDHVISAQQSGIAGSSFEYDAAGYATAGHQGGRDVLFGYDARHRLISVTDPLARTVGFAYDDANRVTTQTLPDGRVVAFTYDENGNITSVTPPGRPAHGFSFTPVDLLDAYAPPAVVNGGATTYQYNHDRQLTLITRPDGQTTTLGYDTARRLLTLTAPTLTDTFGYDGLGHLASIAASTGESLAFSYDGPLLTSQQWSGPVSGAVSWTYDTNLRMASENGVAYSYDNDGLLTRAGALTLIRDGASGFLTGTSIGLLSDTNSYNSFGELVGYSFMENDGVVLNEQYVRDDAGRIASRTESLNGTLTTFGYAYDTAGRIASATRDGIETASYTYNTNSGRATKTSTAGTETATYDDQDRLLTYNGTSYTYTANGELSSKTDAGGTTSYVYDALGNLRTVILPNATQIEYVIDGQNRRVGKKVNGTLVKGWLYGDQLRIVAELDGTGAVVSQFVYGTHANVPDYMLRGGNTYRIITDHVGSPRFLIEAGTAAAIEHIDYDEFGNVLSDNNHGFQPFGFAGGLYDPDTRLVRFGARDYDPQSGRWTTKDPVGFGGNDTNLYGYTSNDPINLNDPNGLVTEVDIWQGVGWGTSSFGHASISIDDTTWSFGPGGMWTGPTSTFVGKQSFRDGIGIRVPLTKGQEKLLRDALNRYKDSYFFPTTTCVSPIKKGLEQLGYDFGATSLSPTDTAIDLLKHVRGMPLVNIYPASTRPQSNGVIPANAPWAN